MSSGQYLRIETIGRKTGRQHQVLVRYIAEKARIVAFPQNSGKQDWVRNIVKNPGIKVYYNDSIYSALASLKEISGNNDPFFFFFTQKYSRPTVEKWYNGQRVFVEISLQKKLEAVDLEEIIYGDLEAAFDAVAADYDHHIYDNPINTWQRDVSIGVMLELFKPGETVLEIGSGTGTETLPLARTGVKVIATDISEKMLGILDKKAKARGLSKNIQLVHCRPSKLQEELRKLGYDQIDGAYSTYGAVNTEPNLESMFTNLHSLLKPNAPLLLGVWNKYCMYEIVGYSLRLNPSLAFARLQNPVPVGKSKYNVSSNAFSVGSLSALLTPNFRLEKVLGVPVFLPPSNLAKYMPNGRAFNLMKKIDLYLGASFPFNRLGDHFLAVYRRLPSNTNFDQRTAK